MIKASVNEINCWLRFSGLYFLTRGGRIMNPRAWIRGKLILTQFYFLFRDFLGHHYLSKSISSLISQY